jgi:hypothetical protein
MGAFLILLILAILIAKCVDDQPDPAAAAPIPIPMASVPSPEAAPEGTPTEATPTEDTPTEDTPTEDTPTEATPTEETVEPPPAPVKKPRARLRKEPKNKKLSSEVVATAPETKAALVAPGTLTVNTYPYSQVWVDGISHGRTPLKDLSLPIGVHEIKMVFPTLANREEIEQIRIQTGTNETLFKRVSDNDK